MFSISIMSHPIMRELCEVVCAEVAGFADKKNPFQRERAVTSDLAG
jgi:hypothetical protein